jgi:hypothetical protein
VVSATAALVGSAEAVFLGSDGITVGGGAIVGAGVGARDVVQDGVGEEVSEVRRPRSLMVSLTGFTGSGGGISMLDCCEAANPFDSSDELSVPSGVESESKSGIGERRFRERRR